MISPSAMLGHVVKQVGIGRVAIRCRVDGRTVCDWLGDWLGGWLAPTFPQRKALANEWGIPTRLVWPLRRSACSSSR